METVLVQSLRSEAAKARGDCYAGFLWDLSNFYEHVSPELLWTRAQDRPFPLAILAISLNQYRGKRFLGLDTMAVECGHPDRGIAAGCAFATFWVQLYAIDPLATWKAENTYLDLSVFIDDLMSDTTGQQEHQVVGRLATGAATLRSTIENELGCKIADHKSAIIASSDSLLQKCKRAFGRYAGATEESAVNLGVDVYAGRRRARRTSKRALAKRAVKFKRRIRRLQMLKKAGANMRELYTTGLQQYALYGAEVLGLDAAELKTAQGQYLKLVGSPSKSSSTALSLTILGNPLWRQALGPFITYSLVIWKSVSSKSFQAFIDLPRLGQAAGRRRDSTAATQLERRNWAAGSGTPEPQKNRLEF